MVMLFCFCCQNVTAQSKNEVAQNFEQVVSSLQKHADINPQEKIHIHFDKPSYNRGDTAWFKIYLVNALGNRLSSISKVVYVDVQKPDGKIHKLLLPVNAGMANGQLLLSDSIYREGTYKLRAYTQWMRNESTDYFFNYPLVISGVKSYQNNIATRFTENKNGVQTDPKDTSTNRIATSGQENILSLNFFPEGGSLVNGIRSKIAFKAVGYNGLSRPVKGYIMNNLGERVATFESMHAGMGVFALVPQSGSSYIAILEDGQQFKLPTALENGFVLSVNRATNQEVLVSIRRTASMETHKEIRVIVQANGQVQEAVKLPMNSNAITFSIPATKIAEGINQITLFSATNQPLAERLIFEQKKPAVTKLESDRTVYNTREAVKLKFDNGLGIVGAYSVAIVKADKITLSEEEILSIRANLLLKSGLRGNIENPNFYFSDTSTATESALDILMLSQGWRRFTWDDIMSPKVKQPKYLAQKGIDISGKVLNKDGDKPFANTKISLLVSKELLFLDTITNSEGFFSFNNLQLGDSVEVILKASSEKDRKNVKIILHQLDEMEILIDTLDKSPLNIHVDTLLKSHLPNNTLYETINTGKIVQGTTLQTVEISSKRKALEIKGSIYPFAAPPPDYTLGADKLQEIVSLEGYLTGRFGGLTVRQNEIWGRGPVFDDKVGRSPVYREGPMAILLNGTKIPDLSGINPRTLTGVQIIKGGVIAVNMATSLMLLEGTTNYGIVFLTMNGIPGKYIKANPAPGLLRISVSGYSYAREFYAPNYEIEEKMEINDFRPTLFWKPDIITAEDGKTEFSFYTSDEKGKYQITLEGIAANGELCRKISYFDVR